MGGDGLDAAIDDGPVVDAYVVEDFASFYRRELHDVVR